MRCMPFSEVLYRTLQHSGLDAESMWNNRERFSRGQRWPASPDGLEDELRWLIAVGVLRRDARAEAGRLAGIAHHPSRVGLGGANTPWHRLGVRHEDSRGEQR